MKNLLAVLFFFTAVLSAQTSNTNEPSNAFKTTLVNLLQKDKLVTDEFNLAINSWVGDFYAEINSKSSRAKNLRKLNYKVKPKLEDLYIKKKMMVDEFRKVFEDEMSISNVITPEMAKSSLKRLTTFFDDWFKNQNKTFSYMDQMVKIFDDCDFTYNSNATNPDQIFLFSTNNCRDQFNKLMVQMNQQISLEEAQKVKFVTNFSSIFSGN